MAAAHLDPILDVCPDDRTPAPTPTGPRDQPEKVPMQPHPMSTYRIAILRQDDLLAGARRARVIAAARTGCQRPTGIRRALGVLLTRRRARGRGDHVRVAASVAHPTAR